MCCSWVGSFGYVSFAHYRSEEFRSDTALDTARLYYVAIIKTGFFLKNKEFLPASGKYKTIRVVIYNKKKQTKNKTNKHQNRKNNPTGYEEANI